MPDDKSSIASSLAETERNNARSTQDLTSILSSMHSESGEERPNLKRDIIYGERLVETDLGELFDYFPSSKSSNYRGHPHAAIAHAFLSAKEQVSIEITDLMGQSPRKEFLDLLAPRWRIPRCPLGNMHNPGLCMGASVPENLGRRYFYCNARRAGKPVCAYGEDTWSPALADTLRTRLNDALELFGNEVRSGSSIRAATNKGLAAFKAAERAQREAAEFSNQLVNPPVGIDIFIYLEERRSTSNGCYSLYSDSNLCDLTNFPARRWSVYDRFIKKFIPIPTFSNFTVIK
ncbi:hypothetical protein GALMADRAFT_217692, partial [Galerina marginata CBS 339.88]